jgi:biopolymer transport protein ExbD
VAAKSKTQIQEEVSPNLIPMIDIMFLLLLFFMLGADMGQRELEEVRLPKALAVQEDKETKGDTNERLTVNVYHLYETDVKCDAFMKDQVCRNENHWRIAIKGVDYTDSKKLEAQLKVEADAFRTDPTNKKLSERPVMVRADASAPFGEVQKVVNTCAKAGIYKIECGAARPPDKEFGDTKATK